ncbi:MULTISPECIES: hypothetical protein [unclassified Flavobacterium]|uniref:hypothetical protein n=1 Tax=unclassified Flavobacterium TaxID=196869 RepID=UPI00131CD1D3|nr:MULTISPECIES: hypothetical protein [unclassified Flavobacterium]
MKKNVKHIVMVWLVVVLVSCTSSKPALTESKIHTITLTETVHDTVFKIEKDSSFFKALLECQNGKVVLKNVTQAEPGRTLKSPRVRVENNKLSVDCQLEEQKLYAFWKSKQVKEIQTETLRIPEYINQLTFLQEIQIWLGRIFLLVLVYYVVLFALKFYPLV